MSEKPAIPPLDAVTGNMPQPETGVTDPPQPDAGSPARRGHALPEVTPDLPPPPPPERHRANQGRGAGTRSGRGDTAPAGARPRTPNRRSIGG